MSHAGGVGDEAFDAAKALGEAEPAQGTQDVLDAGGILQLEAHHGAEALLLSLGEVVLGMAGQAGVVHLGHGRVGFQALGDGRGVGLVGRHAQVQGLEAAQHQGGVVGALAGAQQVVQRRDLLGELRLVRRGHHGSADDIAVAVQILGGAVDDEIGTELKGLLLERAEEGVVHHCQGPAGLRELGDRLNVRQAQQRVAGGLYPDKLRRRCPGGFHRGQIRQIQVGHLQAVDPLGVLEGAEGAAVAVDGGQHVGAVFEKIQGHEDGAHPRARTGGPAAAFQQRDGLLETGAGGIPAAGVVKAAVGTEVGEGEGRGLVNRRHHAAVGGIRL